MTTEFKPGDYILYKGRKFVISSRERNKSSLELKYDLCFCRTIDGYPYLGGGKVTGITHDAIERHLTEPEIVELKLKGLI